jgi:TolB-like protein
MIVHLEADAATTPSLKLRLLGGFYLAGASGPPLSTRKAEALLAYLGVTAGRAHSREKLAAMLWGDRNDSQARHSLAQTLYLIRRALTTGGETALIMKGPMVALNVASIEVDVSEFETLTSQATPETLFETMALYTGDLLEGFYVAAPDFQQWLAGERTRLRELARRLLDTLLSWQGDADDAAPAIAFAHRLLDQDPLDEALHRILMRLYRREGRTEAALRQFQVCADVLRRELDVAPDAETKVLHQEILNSRAQTSVAPEWSEPPKHDRSAARFLNDRPSIAVLPFANLDKQPEHEILGDGMAEDIITGLSRFRWLMVVARSSTFAYKGLSPDIRQIGRDLGVRYVLTGGIRKTTARIRVTTQLIDAALGTQVWVQTYDRSFEDIFVIQDEITDAIVGALGPQIDQTERIRAKRKPPERLDAWTQYQLALAAFYTNSWDSVRAAKDMFDRTTEMDPSFALAYAMAASARNRLIISYGIEDDDRLLEEGGKQLTVAFGIDPQDAVCHSVKGMWHVLRWEFDLAMDSLAHALELNPSSPLVHHLTANVLRRAGRAEEAMALMDRAIRLSPNDANLTAFQMVRAGCLLDLGKYEACASYVRRVIHGPSATPMSYITLIASLVALGCDDEASAVLYQLRDRYPHYTLANFVRSRRGNNALGLRHILGALRHLGFS